MNLRFGDFMRGECENQSEITSSPGVSQPGALGIMKGYIMKIKKRQIFLIIFVLLQIMASCDIVEVGPKRKINIVVSSGLQPMISWDGGPIHELLIDDITENPRKNIFHIYTKNSNNIYSPVKFGNVPDSTEIIIDAEFIIDSLVSGNEYFIEAIMFPTPSTGYGSLKFIATRDE